MISAVCRARVIGLAWRVRVGSGHCASRSPAAPRLLLAHRHQRLPHLGIARILIVVEAVAHQDDRAGARVSSAALDARGAATAIRGRAPERGQRASRGTPGHDADDARPHGRGPRAACGGGRRGATAHVERQPVDSGRERAIAVAAAIPAHHPGSCDRAGEEPRAPAAPARRSDRGSHAIRSAPRSESSRLRRPAAGWARRTARSRARRSGRRGGGARDPRARGQRLDQTQP